MCTWPFHVPECLTHVNVRFDKKTLTSKETWKLTVDRRLDFDKSLVQKLHAEAESHADFVKIIR